MRVADYDPLYIAARSVLLDALEAFGPQLGAVIVVGAQAVYLRTGDADISVAPYTTDADLALAPDDLADEPHIEDLMRGARFLPDGQQPGAWIKQVRVGDAKVDIPVDIMVPEALAPEGGRRSVRIEPHDKMAMRKAPGLEGVVIDNDRMNVGTLDGKDVRSIDVRVAGPAALMVAKLHKLNDRVKAGRADRIADKDAADVFRLMQATPVIALLERLRPLLTHSMAGQPSSAAVELLGGLFGAARSPGVVMAVDALRVAVPPERVEAVCTSFTREILLGLPGH